MDAFQKGMDVQPSFPEGFPAWLSVALATEIPPSLRDAVPASSRGELLGGHPGQMRHDLDHLAGQDLVSGPLWVVAGHIAQAEQAHG